MFDKKSLALLIVFLVSSVFRLPAGDSASFVDLGFSPDGTAYMFGQYGVQAKTLRPWADLFVVDVPRNNFVSGGRLSYIHDNAVTAGQDGAAALYRLLSRNAALADRYGVNVLIQGQPLFIALEDGHSNWKESIEFRDFEAGASYRAQLILQVDGEGSGVRSSFYIDLERTGSDGSRKTYTVGSPRLKRPGVSGYHIKKVIIAPRDGSMIFVIEMKRPVDEGSDIRYMVEALRL